MTQDREELKRDAEAFLKEPGSRSAAWASAATVLSLLSDLEAMQEALRPFANEADEWSDEALENVLPAGLAERPSGEAHKAAFSMNDLRRARQVLSKEPDQ